MQLILDLASIFIFLALAYAQPEIYMSHVCSESGNYTSDRSYQTNLNTLLTTISSDNGSQYGFYNVSVGQNANRVNAVALCRGDLSVATCRSCLNFSTTDILQRCPTQKEAIVWYDKCMLRYSNRSIFGFSDHPSYFANGTRDAADVLRFNERLYALLNNLRDEASKGDSNRKFAMGRTNDTDLVRIYALLQCTPDLTEMECGQCLERMIGNISVVLPSGKLSGRGYCPSCNFRYSVNQFYENFNESSVTSLSPPPADTIVDSRGQGSKRTRNIIIIAVSTVCFIALVLAICVYASSWMRKKKPKILDAITPGKSLQYDFETIRVATDTFSDENKLGQGGFGAVYKGVIDGQEIAVKRLAVNSGQGDTEFKNEVTLVAKLRHRNLVKLHGFCLEGQERLLIYEFMPNSSLDHFLFDPIKRAYLHWERRYKIIGGIAKGLLYLHEDSRLRIIHRDLKASNILLDEEMNPKIADFGMARLFSMDQTGGETSTIVGTYGYMAPEYAMRGQFSMKSDVYSFGILILELVSGQKKSCFRVGGLGKDLISFAWESLRSDRVFDISDPIIDGSPVDEITKCLHIGLLCVQESPAARPTMASVGLMLNNSSISLPFPSRPALSSYNTSESSAPVLDESHVRKNETTIAIDKSDLNEISITELYPR